MDGVGVANPFLALPRFPNFRFSPGCLPVVFLALPRILARRRRAIPPTRGVDS